MRLRQQRRSRRWRIRLGADTGAIQIEFILSILTVLFVMLGIWELVMVVHTMNVLSDAAKEGVRYAIVHGGGSADCSGPNPPSSCTNPDPAGNNVADLVKDYAKYSFLDISALVVTVTYPDGSDVAPNRVRVEVQYDFVPFTALPIRPRLRAAAEGRIVY
jgi:hypothetical protein